MDRKAVANVNGITILYTLHILIILLVTYNWKNLKLQLYLSSRAFIVWNEC